MPEQDNPSSEPTPSWQGYLLVASPSLTDPNFAKTIVLLVQHGPEGALGLVLNRKLEVTVREVWTQVSAEPVDNDQPIFHGGPCEGPLMILHNQENWSQVQIMEGLHFSTEEDAVRWLVENHPQPSRYFVGYSGWGPGQLEAELEQGGWLLTPATGPLVFDDGLDTEGWALLVRAIGRSAALAHLDPKIIPPDPSLN